ncbi:MAG: HAMP domain-containing sensor histidine kinase [Actinomycetota bacterium]
MRLADRTAVAAACSGLLAVIVVTVVASVLFAVSVAQRVDDQLEDRARAAPVLAAIGPRIEVSELSFVVAGARVRTVSPDGDAETVELGLLPAGGLPPLTGPGWRTATADGESWRLYAVEVDHPRTGEPTLVEFVEPLGDVRRQLRVLRRRMITFGFAAALAVGALGFVVARRTARPLTDLAHEVAKIGDRPEEGWTVSVDRSTPEVAEIAGALDDGLQRLAVATRRRQEALEGARSFASAASHELRTPLQSAMTNLDVALTTGHDAHVAQARSDLDRMRTALDAVRRLSEVDLLGDDVFEDADLGEVVDRAIGALGAEGRAATIAIEGPDDVVLPLWVDGVRLAVENLLHNALRHGAGPDADPRVVVTVAPGSVTVDDDGPGVPPEDRARVLRPFERGAATSPGSGLGLAFVDRVAAVHGGAVRIETSPLGGARVVLGLRPPPEPSADSPSPGPIDL